MSEPGNVQMPERRTNPSDRRHVDQLRVEITPTAVAVVLVILAVSTAIINVLVEARRVISWAVASAIVAALIELVVQWLDRWMKRFIAIILVLIAMGAVVALIGYGLFSDINTEVQHLKTEIPEAAAHIETASRFRRPAHEIQLEERVHAAVDTLSSPSSGLAGQAVSSVGTYLVCFTMTVLFLSWGPRVSRAALAQLSPTRAEEAKRVAHVAFVRARHYVACALLQSAITGLIAYAMCRMSNLPAPIPLAVAMSAMTLIPDLGILLGGMPILLLAGGILNARWTTAFAVVIVVLQGVSTRLVQPWIVRRSLYVGPAIVIFCLLAGFELYGVGGAFYGTALGVVGLAVLDSANQHDDDPDLPGVEHDNEDLPGPDEESTSSHG